MRHGHFPVAIVAFTCNGRSSCHVGSSILPWSCMHEHALFFQRKSSEVRTSLGLPHTHQDYSVPITLNFQLLVRTMIVIFQRYTAHLETAYKVRERGKRLVRKATIAHN